MPSIKEILRLSMMEHMTNNKTAIALGCHHDTVKNILTRAQNAGIEWPLPENMDDIQLEELLYPEGKRTIPEKPEPEMEYIDREMHKRGVTLSLLWHEYRKTYPDGLGYTQFCERYRKYTGARKITMHIEHKAGEKMFVDWAGDTLKIFEGSGSDMAPAYLFVSTLGTSGYPFAKGYLSKCKESWIDGHVSALKHYGGVPLILVPDNDKSGVTTPSNYDPELNRTYKEFAEHYGIAVIPARVRRPKDKPKVEKTVKDLETWILAALRNERFFSLAELNAAINKKLLEYCRKPYQKKDGSRESIFSELDRPALRPLPRRHYEYAEWKSVKVNSDYHCEADKQYYSVPYSYAHQKVDIRSTASAVEVFCKGIRICSHIRLYGRPRQYSTDPSHMPENHRQYIGTNRAYFEKWAITTGKFTVEMVCRIFGRVPVEQQAFRSCYGLMRIHKAYGTERFEEACRIALTLKNYGSSYVEKILKSGYDQFKPKAEKIILHANLRGSQYYSKAGTEVNTYAE